MTQTTPREALTQIRLISGVLLKHEIDAILTALREGGYLRTPGTVEVCAKCRAGSSVQIVPEYGVGHHIEVCKETECPLKVMNEKA